MPSTGIRALQRILPASLDVGHYVFAAVLLLRLVALIRLSGSPFLLPSGSDMQFYDQWATEIVKGRWTDHRAFYGLPLYPFCLAAIYWVLGHSPFLPGLCQGLLDAGTALLIYKLVFRVAGSWPDVSAKATRITAAAAAIGWGLFVPAQGYSIILMPTAAAVFAFWLVIWLVVRRQSPYSPSAAICLGTLVGITAMGVATVLFLLPLLMAAIILRLPNPGGRAAAIAALSLGVAAGTSPCWLHNYLVARDPVFLSAHGGINLWLGNNPEATGYPRFPGLHAGQVQMLRDSIDIAETANGRPLKRAEVSAYWSAKARDYIAQNPMRWLALMLRKLGNFANAFEYDDVGILPALRQHRIIFPGIRFGLVAALAVPGLLFSWRSSASARWIAAAISLHVLAVIPIFVTERYRLPVVPGLLVFAAIGLQRLWRFSSSGHLLNAGIYLGVLGLAAVGVSFPRHDPSLWALEAYNSGRLALENKDFPVADRELQRAHALAPGNPETNLALGNLRHAEGDSAQAHTFYEAALQADSKHKGALNNLGVIALEENQPERAAAYFRRALELEPHNAKTHYLLAKALAMAGNRSEAINEAARAVELDPVQPEFKSLQDQLRDNGN
jgi:tetratricopeptide (TPR) repeat protein